MRGAAKKWSSNPKMHHAAKTTTLAPLQRSTDPPKTGIINRNSLTKIETD